MSKEVHVGDVNGRGRLGFKAGDFVITVMAGEGCTTEVDVVGTVAILQKKFKTSWVMFGTQTMMQVPNVLVLSDQRELVKYMEIANLHVFALVLDLKAALRVASAAQEFQQLAQLLKLLSYISFLFLEGPTQ